MSQEPIAITAAPLLNVRRGAQAIDFYKAAFNAAEVFCVTDLDGTVVSQLSIGASAFWLADESTAHDNFSPASLGNRSSFRMILTVDDPDAVFDRAVTAGATVAYQVADQPYGWRVGRLIDPFGHHWEIGKPLA